MPFQRIPNTGPVIVAGGTVDTVGDVTGDVFGNLVGSAGSVSGDVAGNVLGSVASVLGSVGSVVGSVASVVGSVASVLGSVATVLGSVASVVGNLGGSVGGNVAGSVGSVTGAVGSVTGGVGGNVAGSVASVTGNVSGSTASVVGAVGSVTGAVGSVAGGVGGNVAGSVASVAGNVSGSVASVSGGVGGNVAGSVASVLGSVASVLGNVSGSVASVAGSVASVAGNVAGSVGSVAGNVTPDPASIIARVTTDVPYLTRNAFYWPALSGEQFPPTKNASCVYGQRAGKAAYKLTGSIGGNDVVTFLPVSRAPFDTSRDTITWDWKNLMVSALAASGTPTKGIFTVGIDNTVSVTIGTKTAAQLGLGWGIYFHPTQHNWRFVISNGTTKQDIVLAVSDTDYTANVWHRWTVSIDATSAAISFDGTVVGTTTQGWVLNPPTEPATANGFVWSGDAPSAICTHANESLTELQVLYT